MTMCNQSSSEVCYPRLLSRNIEMRATAGHEILWSRSDSPVQRISYWYLSGSSIPDRIWGTNIDAGAMRQSIHRPHTQTRILGFSNEPYEVMKEIPVTFQNGELGEVTACFEAANISFVSENLAEALGGLQAEILNTLEEYEEHSSQLGPEPQRQLDELRRYIRYKQ